MVGKFLEMYGKECNRMGKFLRIRNSIDLKKSLKKGSKIHFQRKGHTGGLQVWEAPKLLIYLWEDWEPNARLWGDWGRIGHQMRHQKKHTNEWTRSDKKEERTKNHNQPQQLEVIWEKGHWLRLQLLKKQLMRSRWEKRNTNGTLWWRTVL